MTFKMQGDSGARIDFRFPGAADPAVESLRFFRAERLQCLALGTGLRIVVCTIFLGFEMNILMNGAYAREDDHGEQESTASSYMQAS
jgi:hypothetical protein